MNNESINITSEERIAKLEAQCKAMLEEIGQLKKELAEEKAKNSKLEEENKSLKEENKQLKEENEQLKTRIVELENQLDTVHKNNPGFNLDAIAEIYKLQDQIKELTNKLETTDKKVEETNQKVEKLDNREMKSDAKILEMINEVKESVKEEVKKEVNAVIKTVTLAEPKAEQVNSEPKTDSEPIGIVKKLSEATKTKSEVKSDGGTVAPKTDRINWKGFYDSLDDDF